MSSQTASTSLPKHLQLTELNYKDENLRRICILKNTRKACNTEAHKPCDKGLMVNGHENKDPRIWLLIKTQKF